MSDHRPSPAEALAAKKRELLRRKLAERGLAPSGTGRPGIAPRPDGARPVASSAQRRMWALQQLTPGTAAYNLVIAFDLTGPLDATALRAALGEVTDRHEILRTVYREDTDGALTPRPLARPAVELPTHDLTGLPAADRDREADRLATELGRRPFDLATDLPLRAALLRTAPDHHVLVLVAHHVAVDEGSWEILLRDLAEHYRRHTAGDGQDAQGSPGSSDSSGRPAGLPAPERPRLQYADVAHWEQGRLTEEWATRQLEYWRGRLDPWPPPSATSPAPRGPRRSWCCSRPSPCCCTAAPATGTSRSAPPP
ncbi:condensation domain-containing protein [Streptomyces sp. URMC 123]|uniref:condensation domain-containing protein n=1 Tax=Streptomyces sp. URMC 123 TaxID=3423403 RepID=UPI003F19A5D8